MNSEIKIRVEEIGGKWKTGRFPKRKDNLLLSFCNSTASKRMWATKQTHTTVYSQEAILRHSHLSTSKCFLNPQEIIITQWSPLHPMQPLKQMTISTWGKELIKTLLCWAFFVVLLQNYQLNAKKSKELSNKMWISLKSFVNKNYEIIRWHCYLFMEACDQILHPEGIRNVIHP